MIRSLGLFLVLMLLPVRAPADVLGYLQTLYDLESVTTRTLNIQLDPVDHGVRFSVTLTDNETGFERRHEFDGSATNNPFPYHLEYRNYCGTDVILLTVEYPWRHALPQYVRVLDTFAFDYSDFSFIDMEFGPPSDFALLDSSDPESDVLRMQPRFLVECLPAGSKVPFRFVENPVE